MHFHFSFYSSLLLIFFSQGIIFSLLLFKKSIAESDRASRWLSLFTFLCSLYLLPWMLGFAGWYSVQPYRDIMFYIPFQQLLLVGPVIYFYTQSLLNPTFIFQRKDWLHFAPALLYLFYRLFIFITDKMVLHEYYFYANGRDKSLDTWYQMTGFCSMIVYFVLTLRFYAVYKKLIFQTLSFADGLLFSWIKKYLIAFLTIQVLWLLFFCFYPGWGDFKEKWWYYFAFSSILYYIGLTGYTNNIKSLVPFQVSVKENKTIYLLESGGSETDTFDEIEWVPTVLPVADEQVEEWKVKIAGVMEDEKMYQNPVLTLADVAKKLGTNQTMISKMINQGFHMNFNDLVNSYRVKAVVSMLQQEVYKSQTLLAISIDCGFNSKTTFNRCFKKFTGISPKEFIRQQNTEDFKTNETEDFAL